MELLEKILASKKNQKNRLENILYRTHPATKSKYAKLKPFVNYDSVEKEKLNRQHQKLKKEIEELEELIKKRH